MISWCQSIRNRTVVSDETSDPGNPVSDEDHGHKDHRQRQDEESDHRKNHDNNSDSHNAESNEDEKKRDADHDGEKKYERDDENEDVKWS